MLAGRFGIILPPENISLMQFLSHQKTNNLLKNLYCSESKKSKPSWFNRMYNWNIYKYSDGGQGKQASKQMHTLKYAAF